MKFNYSKKILIGVVGLFWLLIIAPLALAQSSNNSIDLQVKIGDTEIQFDTVNCQPGQSCTIDWISQYIKAIYTYGVGVAVILAVVMIMVGGFLWLTSGGSPDRVGKAKDSITAALSGLLLALFSFIILQAVNPALVNLNAVSVYSPSMIEGSGDARYYAADGSPIEMESTVTAEEWEFIQANRNETALTAINNLVDTYDLETTSYIRDDGSRHDPQESGYVGNVVDFHYEPNSAFHQYIVNNATNIQTISWGTAYFMPDGSVAVLEPGGSTGYHWHYEVNVPGWTWRAAR